MEGDLPDHHAHRRAALPPRAGRRHRQELTALALPTTEPPRDPPAGWAVAPVGPAEARRIRIEVVVVLLLLAVPGLLIGLEGIDEPTSVTTDVGLLELLASVAGAAGAAAMATYLLWRDGRLAVAGFHRRSPGFVIGYGLLGLVAVYLALLGALVVSVAVYAAVGGDTAALADEGEETGIDLTAASLAVGYLIAVTAGITEEIVYRAYAITRLQELGWRRASYIVPGVVFTLLHLYQGVLAIVLIGAVTAVFTWLYRWKRSLLPLMLAHALFDAVQLTLAAVVGD